MSKCKNCGRPLPKFKNKDKFCDKSCESHYSGIVKNNKVCKEFLSKSKGVSK